MDYAAPDTYRVFVVRSKLSKGEGEVAVWLSGNNKGKGAECEMVLPYAAGDIADTIVVHDWDQIPPGSCF